MVESYLEHACQSALYDYQDKHGLPKGFVQDVICLFREEKPQFRNSLENDGWHGELQRKLKFGKSWDERDIARAEQMWTNAQSDLGLFD